MSKDPIIHWTEFVCDQPATEEEAESYGVKPGELIDREVEHRLPGRWAICDGCRGNGTHSKHLGAITREERERDWDDDEWDAYMGGAYDKICEDCIGSGKIVVVNEEACDKDLLGRYQEDCDQRARDDYADRRMRWMEDGCREPFDGY